MLIQCILLNASAYLDVVLCTLQVDFDDEVAVTISFYRKVNQYTTTPVSVAQVPYVLLLCLSARKLFSDLDIHICF